MLKDKVDLASLMAPTTSAGSRRILRGSKFNVTDHRHAIAIYSQQYNAVKRHHFPVMAFGYE